MALSPGISDVGMFSLYQNYSMAIFHTILDHSKEYYVMLRAYYVVCMYVKVGMFW